MPEESVLDHATNNAEQLRQSDERFRLMVESIKDYAIIMLDPSGNVSSWNEGAQRIKQYQAQEIIGRHMSVFYSAEDLAGGKPARLLRHAREAGRVEDEGWRIRKDGTRFWADVVLTALRDKSGTLIGFAKVTRELTERTASEESTGLSEERFRLMIEAVKDYAIFMLDPEGKVATWNEGAQRIKQYRADEIIGQHFSRFYPGEDVLAGKCERELEIAARDGRFEDEGWRVRKDGTLFWANVVIAVIRNPDGKLLGFAKVTRDLTERRLLEEEKVRLAQAQEAIRLRDEFLSIASHELKTPLTALQLQLQSLYERAKAVDAQLASRLDRATRSGARLADLIETLLDVSRIATGRFELNPTKFDLSEAVGEVVERMSGSAAQARCTIETRLQQGVIGVWDRVRIEQILANLLSNAFRYGAGMPVTIIVKSDSAQAQLEILDEGPGIPEKDLSRIFERFERASSARNYGGMGLGLYVTRQIVDAHGGSVSAHNRKDRGAAFTVVLPLAPVP